MCSNSKRTRRSGTSTASNSWYGTHRSVGFPDRSRHRKNHDPGAKFRVDLHVQVVQEFFYYFKVPEGTCRSTCTCTVVSEYY